MVSKRKRERLEVLTRSSDWDGFLEEFQHESDRATAILGAAFLDEQLLQLLNEFLIDDETEVQELLNTERPLGSFGPRIRAAYCMGLMPKEHFNDLKAIKEIRNKFAHQLHGLSFEHESIVKACDKLQTPKPFVSRHTESPRDKFLRAVVLLMMFLGIQILSVSKHRCKAPLAPKVATISV